MIFTIPYSRNGSQSTSFYLFIGHLVNFKTAAKRSYLNCVRYTIRIYIYTTLYIDTYGYIYSRYIINPFLVTEKKWTETKLNYSQKARSTRPFRWDIRFLVPLVGLGITYMKVKKCGCVRRKYGFREKWLL